MGSRPDAAHISATASSSTGRKQGRSAIRVPGSHPQEAFEAMRARVDYQGILPTKQSHSSGRHYLILPDFHDHHLLGTLLRPVAAGCALTFCGAPTMHSTPAVSSPPLLAAAMENRRSICEPRGYCGPFVDEGYFARFPDRFWHGTANCIHCGNTVNVGDELDKWERALVRCLLDDPEAVIVARSAVSS